MAEVALTKKLPLLLKNQVFWTDLTDSLSEELNLLKAEEDEKKSFLKPLSIVDTQDLIDLARSFGYDPNLILDSSLEYTQQEVESIFYKIINKSIFRFYEYIFKLIPYPGKVYLVYFNDVKLLKAYDYAAIVPALDLHNLQDVFKDFIEERYYFNLLLQGFSLDEIPPRTLDELVPWSLDEASVVKPTSHIALEYVLDKLITVDAIEYLLPKDYFWYIEKSALYGKKATNIPNIGAQLNLVVNESLWYDDYDFLNTGYTWADIKTKCTVSSFYKTRVLLTPMQFDDSPDVPFDQAIAFIFDTSDTAGIPKVINQLFTKARVGDGSKALPSKNYPDIWRNLLFFASFDELSGTAVDDLSTNNYTATIGGSFSRVQGISGKTVDYNGTDTEVSIASFVLADEDMTLMMWMDETISILTDRVLFFHSPTYKLFIFTDGSGVQLQLDVTGGSGSVSGSLVIDADQNAILGTHMIAITRDVTGSEIKLRIYPETGAFIETTIDTTTAGTISGSSNAYLGSDSATDYFEGLIDETRIYNKILPDDEILYFRDTKLGSLKNLSNRVYTLDTIDIDEIHEENDWKMVTVNFLANCRNDEVLGVGDDVTDTFNYTLDYFPAQPKYFKLSYTATSILYNVTDDGNGFLIGDRASGTINYDTGAVVFNAFKDITILREVISVPPITVVAYTTDNDTVTASTVFLRFNIGATAYLVGDDGAGNFTHGTITSGTITYSTGAIAITFVNPVTDLTVDYTYRVTDEPDNLTNIDLVYRKRDDSPLEITEFGLFDDDDNQVLYATFPPIQFNSHRDHISFNVAIKDI